MFFTPYGFTGLQYIIPAMILAFIAQGMVSSAYGRFSKVSTRRGTTGYEVARRILDMNGLYDVKVVEIGGKLSDHYDPRRRVVRLSSGIFRGSSIASVSVAAHECGHALQHAKGYVPLTFRSLLAPVVSVTQNFVWVLVVLGVLFSSTGLIDLGIVFFLGVILFQMVTLPVEFNASNRAIRLLGDLNVLYEDEVPGARKMLNAAALTYVAAVAMSLAQLMRLLMIRNRD
jgi:Zn-dependent membrane protease YugP